MRDDISRASIIKNNFILIFIIQVIFLLIVSFFPNLNLPIKAAAPVLDSILYNLFHIRFLYIIVLIIYEIYFYIFTKSLGINVAWIIAGVIITLNLPLLTVLTFVLSTAHYDICIARTRAQANTKNSFNEIEGN